MHSSWLWPAIVLLAAASAAAFGACSASGEGDGPGSGGTTAAGGSTSSGGTVNFGGSGTGGGVGGDCAEVSETAENKIQPSDIIIAVDQSGSMDLETSWVQAQLGNFANQITQSGIDVHVVLIAGPPGTENGICIGPPLGSGNCPDDDVLPTFLHVKQHVDSSDALIQIINNYSAYASVLRPDASKDVVVITDDDSAMAAATFDTDFKALDPPHLDDYVFHAIAADEDDPGTFECIINPQPCCGVAADEGQVYKQLVQMTGGIFGDLCLQNFQPIWTQLSTQVINSATLACEWDIPEPPEGETFDPSKVNVEFSDGVTTTEIGYVPSEADCASVNGGWYYDDPSNPTKILVCPETCQAIQGIDGASIHIKFGCDTVLATPR